MAGNKNIEVRPVAGALGAEIAGVNLAQGIDGDAVAAIREALLEHQVVFFRGQDLTSAQYQAFAEKFGELAEYPMISSIEGYPKIIPVVKLEHETVNFGGIWHTDTTYLDHPPMGTMLLARELPPRGGDTLFANQVMAYEALSPGMRRMLDPLIGINTSTLATASRTREDRLKDMPHEEGAKEFTTEHPVVRTHPETGRKSLFVNVGHTERFQDMTVEESRPLLDFLFQHQVQPQFTCRFVWQPGSLAFWDNRSSQHNAVNDYNGSRRVMHRITLAGDTPR
jgi:taurine dioxygenase